MAGIGFELKRIFKKDSLFSVLSGAIYSTIVVIGPTIIVMGTMLVLYTALGYMNIIYSERELLSSTILYIFLGAQLITAPISSVMSRYVGDKLFEEQYQDILPSYYTGMVVSIGAGLLLSVPIVLRMVLVGKVDELFAGLAYILFIALVVVFYSLAYLTATKDFKIISGGFLFGMVIAFIVASIAKSGFDVPVIYAILIGLCVGFSAIGALQLAYIRYFFPEGNGSYGKCLSYFKYNKLLFWGTALYTLGIYVHNFVFWQVEGSLFIAETFRSYQPYDMAACLAVFTSISATVIFTVMSETKFHDIYQKYNEAVIGATLEDIELAKKNMFYLLIQQIGYVVRVQLIISVILFLIFIIFLPDLGFGGLEMIIYPSLAAAYFCVFVMYGNIIFLHYFNDAPGVFFTGLVFFGGTLVGSLISRTFEPQFYGMGALAGALIGWTFSYFRIRYLEKHFDYHIMCKMHIIKTKHAKRPSSVVYRKVDSEVRNEK